MNRLATQAWLSLVVVAMLMGLLVFVPAGTLHYWEAWLFLAIFLGASAITTLYLLRRDPALVERRMRGGPTAEKRTPQRIIMLFTSAAFIALLVVPALDHRFGWSHMSNVVVIAGDVLVVLGFSVIALVYRENTFASATIQLAENQTVISTGPYAAVRHPMYAGATLLLFGMPIALGSYWGILPAAAMIPLLVWRLTDEERFLAANLTGYSAYQQRVRYRLVPFLW